MAFRPVRTESIESGTDSWSGPLTMVDALIGLGGPFAVSPTALLARVLSGFADPLSIDPLVAAGMLDPAMLFDGFTTARLIGLRPLLDRLFAVVAYPRRYLPQLVPGDLLLRRALGEPGLGHAAFIASQGASRDNATRRGLRLESARPGFYAHVVEAGSHPHRLSESFARRIASADGKLPADTIILRPLRKSSDPASARSNKLIKVPLEEAGSGSAGGSVTVLGPLPGTVPLTVDIRGEKGGSLPSRILATGKSRKYRAAVAPAGGTISWTCTGGASIVGSHSAELVTIRGDVVSTRVDDVVLTLVYLRGLSSQSQEIKLTVADVTKIAVRVKASAAMTPGRGPGLTDHQFDCTETVEAFPADKSLILLRGDFEDIELQATVNPTGTPLAWDVKRANDDDASLGTGLPKLDQDPADKTKGKLKANETGSFFVRVFGDGGDQKFDANGPLKLVPTVLVRATLKEGDDASKGQPANTPLPRIVGGPTGFINVESGGFDITHPELAAIHMIATVDVVSGGADGRRLIDRVFAGWVNNLVADVDWLGSYQDVHSIHTVFATNDGTGPFVGNHRIFQQGDQPQLVPVSHTAPLLDAGRPNSGTGGGTATLRNSRISRTDLPLGQQWIVEGVDSPSTGFPLLHPIFSTDANPVRLQGILFEAHFKANLCLWTSRIGDDVAERSYGVIHWNEWQMLAAWSIDAANHITETRPMSIPISFGPILDPLARPSNAFARCEVCAPTALSLIRHDGSI